MGPAAVRNTLYAMCVDRLIEKVIIVVIVVMTSCGYNLWSDGYNNKIVGQYSFDYSQTIYGDSLDSLTKVSYIQFDDDKTFSVFNNSTVRPVFESGTWQVLVNEDMVTIKLIGSDKVSYADCYFSYQDTTTLLIKPDLFSLKLHDQSDIILLRQKQ